MVNRLMALLDEILTWTETALPLWQRDAARRLVQNQSGLSDDDYTELYALLKAANGLPNPLACATTTSRIAALAGDTSVWRGDCLEKHARP